MSTVTAVPAGKALLTPKARVPPGAAVPLPITTVPVMAAGVLNVSVPVPVCKSPPLLAKVAPIVLPLAFKIMVGSAPANMIVLPVSV